MDKHESKELTNLISAYHQIGGILLDRLNDRTATMPKTLGGLISDLRGHTSLMYHIVSNIHANVQDDVPNPDRDKYEVELACGISFTVEGVKTRQEAIDQVESGYYDEYISTLVATAAKEGRFKKVERIRPVDEKEKSQPWEVRKKKKKKEEGDDGG